MEWKKHSEWENKHSILSASKSPWLRYSDEKLYAYVEKLGASARGTALHTYACMAIKLGQKQPNNQQTVNMYINDAIGYLMQPEVILFYSPWAFGTADAIYFGKNREPDVDTERKVLRIYDLKTGEKPVNGEQLVVYAAYFCLEYKQRPYDIDIDLRIYQNDAIQYFEADAEEITHVMSRITELSALITARMEEEV